MPCRSCDTCVQASCHRVLQVVPGACWYDLVVYVAPSCRPFNTGGAYICAPIYLNHDMDMPSVRRVFAFPSHLFGFVSNYLLSG